MKYKPQIGDIFEVQLPNDTIGYLQYIANDLDQLNSDVVRVFKTRYPIERKPQLDAILADAIEFYYHVTGVEFGVKDWSWTKVGNSADVGVLRDAFFRTPGDGIVKRENGLWGLPEVSKTWYVWRLGEPKKFLRKLEGDAVEADYGEVTWPKFIVERMKTGKSHGSQPDYE